MSNPILHLLGLVKKAGRLEVGEEPVGSAARSRQAKLLLVASDATDNTCRRAAHFAEAGNILWFKLPVTKSELGYQIGRGMVAMIAITDAGFAATITEKLASENPDIAEHAQTLRTKANRVYARQKEQRQHEKNLARGKHKPWAVPAKQAKKVDDSAKSPKKAKNSRHGGLSSAGTKPHDGSKPSTSSARPTGDSHKPFSKAPGRKFRVSRGGTSAHKTLRNEVAAHDE